MLFFMLFYITSSYWSIALVMFGYCFFLNACLPQIEAATLNSLGNNKHQYGRIRLWGSVGFIIAVLGIGALMDILSPAILVSAGSVTLAILFLVSLFVTFSGRLDGSVGDTKSTAQWRWQIVFLLFLCFLMQLSHAPYYTFFSIYLAGYDYSRTQIGLLWSVAVLFEIFVFIYGGYLFRRFAPNILLICTFAVATLRWWLVAQFPQIFSILFFSQVLHAITYALYHSVVIQMIDRFFVRSYQVRGQALYSCMSFGLGGAVGSLVSGYMWTEWGGTVLFSSASVMMLLISITLFCLLKWFTRRKLYPV